MKNKIATTIEQSKKLLELWIDPRTADMMWTYDFTTETINELNVISKQLKPETNDIPAWSLSALIEILPSELELPSMFENITYEIRIRKYNHIVNELNLYQIAYGSNQGLSKSWHDMINTSEQEDLLDAVFEMIVYLKENKLI